MLSFLSGLPLEGFNPVYRFPIVTWALVAACLAMFGVQVYLGPALPAPLMFVPSVVLSSDPLSITWLTSMFMHGGLGHLLGNLYFLKIFGDNVEDRLGRLEYIAFYFVCGLAAKLTHALTTSAPDLQTLGASGAISGALGAYLVFFPQVRISLMFLFRLYHLPAWVLLLLWFAMQGVLGALSSQNTGGGVAFGSHLGGFAVGFILAGIAKRFLPDARLATLRAQGEEEEA
jgi:membrane associated rhomboid family serine protease